MKRRVIDRFLLLDATIASAAIEVTKYPVAGNISFLVSTQTELMDRESGTQEGDEVSPVQVARSTVSVSLTTSEQGEAGKPMLSGHVKVIGLFALKGGDPIGSDELEHCKQDFPRLIFPLARSELSRMLSRARVPEVPLTWDIGSSEEDSAANLQRASGHRGVEPA